MLDPFFWSFFKISFKLFSQLSDKNYTNILQEIGMIGPRNYKRLDFYIEEISELYEDSLKSDGFDAHYFNEKIHCYWLFSYSKHFC